MIKMRKLSKFIILLILCSLIVSIPNIELLGASEPAFSVIEPHDVRVSGWYASPELITEPTTIIIVSPENRTYATSNVTLTVNLGTLPIYEDVPPRNHYIRTVSFKTDWMESQEQIFYHLASYRGVWHLMPLNISLTLDLIGVPEGNHNLTVYAGDSYFNVTTSTVNFTVDSSFQETNIPEFPSWTPLLIMLIAVMTIVFIYKRKLKTSNFERRLN
jgi:hypothetical protein